MKFNFTLGKYIILGLVGLILALSWSAYVFIERLERDKQSSFMSIADTTGSLIEILIAHRRSSSSLDVEDEIKIRRIIRKQVLVLVVGRVDVKEMDAESFESMCQIVSNKDFLFGQGSVDKIEFEMDKFLLRELEIFVAPIDAEYHARLSGSAVPRCEGFSNSTSSGK